MKPILTIFILLSLVVLGLAQTRNVVVGTNGAVVSPTNFWSADVTNARSGLGLGTAATNPATAFQPSSTVLSNLASSNGGSLTNLTASNVTGTIAISNGGSGATTAGGARTNLGLVLTALTNTDVTNFRTAIGVGVTNDVGFNSIAVTNAAATRTNLGLGWIALTNTNTVGFNTSLYGSGTNPVLYNTNGEVVSPTNFWQVAPISATVQYQTNVTGTSTNAATNSRNLFLFSLAPSVSGLTNTVTLPTNTATTFEGDRATIIHLATNSANTVTAIRQLGAATNLITLNQVDEAVLLMYRSGAWVLSDNVSYVEPIFFSGTNAGANAAASRTNLGIPLAALTNTNNANFQAAIFNTNSVPTNSANVNAVNFNTAIHWMEVNVVTNGATNNFRIPLFK